MSMPRLKPSVSRTAAASLLPILATVILVTAPQGAPPQSKKSPAQHSEKSHVDQSDDEHVKLHSDMVVVSVTVTDSAGQYAHGLTAGDFSVLEDNASQSLNTFFTEEAPFAAAVLIDMSGSMDYKFGLVRAAAASFVDHIRDDDQVAVYGFNNKVRKFQDFSNLRDISDYVWDAKAEDQTRLYDCVDEAIEALAKREEKRRAVLLISDGCDTTSSKASMESVMKRAFAAGVTIFTVDLIDDTALLGSGSSAAELQRGRAELKRFASESGGRYIHSPQGDKLEEAFTNVVDELRNQYTLTYYSNNTRRDGRWRKIAVGVSRPGLVTRARKGYWAPKN